MTSKRDSEILTRTYAETPLGELMRQYWLPALRSDELAADGDPVRFMLFGEKLIAFRDGSGRVGIMDHRYPHRRGHYSDGDAAGLGDGKIKFDELGGIAENICDPVSRPEAGPQEAIGEAVDAPVDLAPNGTSFSEIQRLGIRDAARIIGDEIADQHSGG